ncbi:MAG: hypothetical protein NVS1B6_09320 [Steroidobacteraceae bacterium]
MSRQIIILENQIPARGDSEPVSYRYAFWLAVPLSRQPFRAKLQATATSAVNTATAAEILAIQNGSVKEEVGIFSQPPGTNISQIQALLQVAYTDRQAAINSAAAHPWDHYNSSFDGAAWTIVTVA